MANNRPNLRSSVAGMKPVLLKKHSYFTKKLVASMLYSLGAVLLFGIRIIYCYYQLYIKVHGYWP